MLSPKFRAPTVDLERYTVLTLTPPFVSHILQTTRVDARDFQKVVRRAGDYPNDPRLVEMVRKAGDASGKVPYLLAEGETPATLLAALREAAQPHLARLRALPEPLYATIELLLSINAVPQGCEKYSLTALLELDRIQRELTATLHGWMGSRQLAADFHAENCAALEQLDQAWAQLQAADQVRHERSFQPAQPLPADTRMQFMPFYDQAGRLLDVQETCVLVDAPGAALLWKSTPPVLQRPLPEAVPVPAAGSADWLIREVGKIGRHFTRALLEIIQAHLEAERVALENYELVQRHAEDALREYVEDNP